MSDFTNRVLRPVRDFFQVIVNGEIIGIVRELEDGWAAVINPEISPEGWTYWRGALLREAATNLLCQWAEDKLDDYFFIVENNPEPDDPSTLYFVTMAARGSGRVIESYTTSDAGAAVEAFRETQEYTFEERLGEYGIEWQREQEDRRMGR